MADTKSIASRMEKLAKLKRMKQGLSASDTAVAAETENPQAAPTETAEISDVIAAPDLTATRATDSADAVPSLGGAFDQVAEDSVDAHTGGAYDDIGQSAFADEAGIDDTEIPDDLRDDTGTDAVAEDTPDPVDAPAAPEENPDPAPLSAADLGIDEDAMEALDDLVALAGVGETAAEPPLPDFTTKEIDPELLAREFEGEVRFAEDSPRSPSAESSSAEAPTAAEHVDGRIAVTFDESRTTLLNHVSRQMNCSVEDVVVTALDWYLDALFGEDGEAKTG